MKEERIWPRPQIIPLPRQTMEIERPVRSLNEAAWKICRESPVRISGGRKRRMSFGKIRLFPCSERFFGRICLCL